MNHDSLSLSMERIRTKQLHCSSSNGGGSSIILAIEREREKTDSSSSITKKDETKRLNRTIIYNSNELTVGETTILKF